MSYRSLLTITVLSDQPIEGMNIGEIIDACDAGDMVASKAELKSETLTPFEMEKALMDTDDDFFEEEEAV